MFATTMFFSIHFTIGEAKNTVRYIEVREVEEESGTSMLPASAILENCCFSALSNVEYIFLMGNR